MTTQRHFTLFLQDMIDACDECPTFVEDMTFEEFDRDRKTKLAVEREIEIIGEAVNNLPEHIQQSAPEVPWHRIIGMRNRLAHAFFSVNHEIVWTAVQGELSPLRQSVERLLNEASR